jgi:two-component system cell cycle response regulator DivK
LHAKPDVSNREIRIRAPVSMPAGSDAYLLLTRLQHNPGAEPEHFRSRFGAAPGRAAQGGTMQSTVTSRRAGRKVLIVEDNELNMKLFNDLLEAHGYTTLQTKNGREALDIARTHRPDLILMDIQLPEVSGLEITKWLKEDEELRGIPVVAVTAFAMKGDEEKIRQGGCEGYIAKPISIAGFMKVVEHHLAEAI